MWDISIKFALKLLNIIMGLVICLEMVWNIVGNFLESFGKFAGNLWNTSFNHSPCKTCVLLKKTDRYQLRLSPE